MPCPTLLRRARTFLRHTWTALADLWKPARASYRPIEPTRLSLEAMAAREVPLDLMGILRTNLVFGGLPLLTGSLPTPLQILTEDWSGSASRSAGTHETELVGSRKLPEETRNTALAGMFQDPGREGHGGSVTPEHRREFGQPVMQASRPGLGDSWLDAVGAFLDEGKSAKPRGASLPANDEGSRNGGGGLNSSAGDSLLNGGPEFSPSSVASVSSGSHSLPLQGTAPPPSGNHQTTPTDGSWGTPSGTGGSVSGNNPGGGETGNGGGQTQSGESRNPLLSTTYGRTPLSFEINRGQYDDRVRYASRGAGFQFWLTDDALVFGFLRQQSEQSDAAQGDIGLGTGQPPEYGKSSGRDVFQMRLLGMEGDARLAGEEQQASRSNYFLGNDPAGWHSGVSQYARVNYQGVYPGVDLTLRSQTSGNRVFEYDFTLAPGADASSIRLAWEGLEAIRVDEQGRMVLRTGGGEVIQEAPVAYQMIEGQRVEVPVRHVLRDNGEAGFEIVGEYDRSLPLVIDPVLSGSTYLGGTGTDKAYGIAVDALGNTYVTGETDSGTFPVGLGYDSTPHGGKDVFVTKLDPTGTQRVWSTFLGTSGDDVGFDVALDAASNAYVVGYAGTGFPTINAYQGSSAVSQNPFITRINASGDLLGYSTYLNGSSTGFAEGIYTDAMGNAWVAGTTYSSNFPVTGGVLQSTYGGLGDGFVARFAPDGTRSYTTFLGGASLDAARSIFADSAGNAYVTGYTQSSAFPTTTPVYDRVLGGTQDAFVTKINPTGTTTVFSTYLGGTGTDTATALTLGLDGRVWVTGATNSSNYPVTGSAHRQTIAGNYDAFVTQLDAVGLTVTASTFLGGTVNDAGQAIALDSQGRPTVTGFTGGSGFPTYQGFQTTYGVPILGGGTSDAFIARLTTTATLTYSSYHGGSGHDDGRALALDARGEATIAGFTASTDMPGSTGMAQPSNGGGFDAFVARILTRPPSPVLATISSDTGSSSTDLITTDQTLSLTGGLGSAGAYATVTLERAGVGVIGSVQANAAGTFTYDYTGTTLPEGTHTFTARATDALGVKGDYASKDFLVTIDRTAPTVTVSAPTSTPSRGPEVRVVARDLVGIASNATVSIDVDKNNDGDYADAGETSYTTATLSNGMVILKLPTLAGTGTYNLQARVTDLAGNQGTSATHTFAVTSVSSPWTATAQTVSVDPMVGDWQTQMGDVSVSHGLDLDRSHGTSQGGNPALVYHSAQAFVVPVVRLTIPSDNSVALPASISARLTYNGTQQVTVTMSTTGKAPGDVLTLALQSPVQVTTTGRQTWSVLVVIAGQANQTINGSSYEVTAHNSVFGAGWQFSGVDRLVSIAADANGPAGMLRVYGTGGWRFYQGTTTFTSPVGDNGTLTLSGGTYTYSTPDGQDWVFNSSGLMTQWESADNKELITYAYDGSNRLSGMTAIDGRPSTFTYTGSSSVSILTVNSRTTTLTLSSGKLASITNPDGGVRTFTYDASGRLTREQNGPSLENNWAYTGGGHLNTYTWGTTASSSKTVVSPGVAQGVSALASGTVLPWTIDPTGNKSWMELDTEGRTLQSLAPTGALTQWTYSSGYVATQTDPLGRVTTYTRDAQGYETQRTNPDGSIVTMQYQSAFHALTTMINERGYTTTYAYDGSGHLIRSTDALGQHTTFNYNATTGLLESTIDPRGNRTTMLYDSVRRPSGSIDALGNRTTTTYDSNGNVQTTSDALGRVTTQVYDSMGRLDSTTDPLGRTTTYTQDTAGLDLATTDPLGVTTSVTYDSYLRGLVDTAVEGVGAVDSVSAAATYDAAGRTSMVWSRTGWSSSLSYDANGAQTGQTDALGGISRVVYDLAGQQIASRDEAGRWTYQSYDAQGRVLTSTDALNNVTTYGYDTAGNQTSVTDPLGRTLTTTYDALNRKTGTLDALGRRTTTTYDAAGNVSTQSDAMGNVTSQTYDALNRQLVQTMAVGTAVARTTEQTYDAVGNVKGSKDATGKWTTYTYDAGNRTVGVQDALGRWTTTAYDAAGNVSSVTDGLGKVTTYLYDSVGRQVGMIDPSGVQTTAVLDAENANAAGVDGVGEATVNALDPVGREAGKVDSRLGYTYTATDAAGNVRLIVDPVGNEWHYVRDVMGREILRQDPSGEATTTTYDALGRTTSVVDRNSRTIAYSYDSADRLTGEVWKSSASVTVNVVTYGYDVNDNRLTAADYAGTITSSYDALNRQRSYTNTFGQVLTYSYDVNDRRTLREDSFGGVLTSVYDDAGQLTSRRFGGVAQTQARVDFAYSAQGALTTLTRYTDVAGTTTLGTTSYLLDSAGKPTSILTKNGTGTTLAYYNYSYNSGGQLTAHNWYALYGGTGYTGTRTYTYDSTDQLTNDSTTTYTYDANGNRTMSGYQTGVANRMVNDGVFTLTYDDEGNLSSKSKGSGLETWYYSWSNRNQLLNVRKTSNGSTTTLSVTYTYDVEGHRVQEDKWKTGVGGTTARFAWDGEDIWADLDGSNGLSVRYVQNDGIDQLLARIVYTGAYTGLAFYLTDNLGSVRAILDGNFDLRYTAEYDGFGKATEMGAAWGDRYNFTGREYDADTGLRDHRRRQVDVVNGRWLSEDPIGFEGGDANIYRYAINNGTGAVDPLGLTVRVQAAYRLAGVETFLNLRFSSGMALWNIQWRLNRNSNQNRGGVILQHMRLVYSLQEEALIPGPVADARSLLYLTRTRGYQSYASIYNPAFIQVQSLFNPRRGPLVLDYWEAWNVTPNSTAIRPLPDDQFGSPKLYSRVVRGVGVETMGTVSWHGEAYYLDNVTPADLVARGFRTYPQVNGQRSPAGVLLSASRTVGSQAFAAFARNRNVIISNQVQHVFVVYFSGFGRHGVEMQRVIQ